MVSGGHASDVDARGGAATRQHRATAQVSGLQTSGSSACSRDQSQQSDYHLASGTIHEGRSLTVQQNFWNVPLPLIGSDVAMRNTLGFALLPVILAASAFVFSDLPPQSGALAEDRFQAASPNGSDEATVPKTRDGKPRVVSREGAEYLERRRKSAPFGTVKFDLQGLRAGMGTRNEPRVKGVRLLPLKIRKTP